MKRIRINLWCVVAILSINGLCDSQIAYAQFEHIPESVILDNTKYQFFSNFFQEHEVDFTAGGSSLKIISPPPGFSFPSPGVFLSGDNTIFFDYKFDQKATMENLSFQAYAGSTQSTAGNLEDTAGLWCRVSVYLPVGTDIFQWFTLKDDLSNSLILFDNVQIENGNQQISTKCFDSDSGGASGGTFLGSIVSFLLDDEVTTPGSFSGSIALPSGVVAGAGGVTLRIQTFPLEFRIVGFEIFVSSTEVTIPQGSNSVNYRIDLQEDPTFETKGLEFRCLSGCESLDVTTAGLWSEVVGVTNFFNDTDYSHYADNDVDILLEPADSFSGTVQLPNALTFLGTEFIVIRVSEVNVLFGNSFTTFLSPGVGETSWPFNIGAPSDSTAPNWSIEISCFGCDGAISTASQFATTVNGNPLSTNPVNKHLFVSDQDFTGIELELLLVTP